MRKLIYSVLALGAAFSIAAVGNGASASAAGATVSISTDTKTLTVTGSEGATEAFFAVPTVGKGKKENADKVTLKVTSWDVYDLKDKAATIDLSSLSNTKDNYIEIKTNKDEVQIYKISAVDASTVATFKADDATLTVKAGAKKSEAEVAAANYEVLTKDGKDALKDASDSYAIYQERGATLYAQTKAVNATGNDVADAKVYDVADKTFTAPLTIKDGGKFAGKQAKIAIAKRANAPKITADYGKNTVTIAKGNSVRYVKPDGTLGTWSEALADKKTYNLSDIFGTDGGLKDSDAGNIECRVPAKTGTTTKAASKISVLEVSKPASVTKDDVTYAITTDVTTSKDGKVTTTSYKGVTITNNRTDLSYNIYALASDKTELSALKLVGTVKVATTKEETGEDGAKKTTTVPATLKIAKGKVAAGSKLYAAIVGKAPNWAGEATLLEGVEIAYPADVKTDSDLEAAAEKVIEALKGKTITYTLASDASAAEQNKAKVDAATKIVTEAINNTSITVTAKFDGSSRTVVFDLKKGKIEKTGVTTEVDQWSPQTEAASAS
jgi:hypothetical protein